ncbi:MAG: YdeI/OmpD-associated family protein [Myxococcota bacterium]
MEFEGELVRSGGPGSWTVVAVPPEAAPEGRARVPVHGTVDGRPFRSSLLPDGKGGFFLVVNAAMRGTKQHGARVRVRYELDPTPREVEVPPELAEALAGDPMAKVAFQRLSYSCRKEYADFVAEAKREETRRSRAHKVLPMVREGARLKG